MKIKIKRRRKSLQPGKQKRTLVGKIITSPSTKTISHFQIALNRLKPIWVKPLSNYEFITQQDALLVYFQYPHVKIFHKLL